MADPTSFLQGSDGDLDVSLGLRRTNDLKTFVQQKLSETFNFWEGEWLLDTREGFPYWRAVIGQKPDVGFLASLFRRGALATPGVGDVLGVAIDFDSVDRVLNVRDLTVRLTTGEVVTFAPYLIPV